MPVGRPLKFKNLPALRRAIVKYFRDCDPHPSEVDEIVKDKETGKQKVVKKKIITDQVPYTITGLALALGTSRQTLLEYEGEVEGRGDNVPGYADAIKDAKLKCEQFAEGRLFGGSNVAGPIFNLKNNYRNWKDKTEIDHGVSDKLGALMAKIHADKQPLVKPESGDPERDDDEAGL